MLNNCRLVSSSNKGGALWLMYYITGIRQHVSSFVVHWLFLFPRPIHFPYPILSCKAHTVWAASPYSHGYDSLRCHGRCILYAKICFGSDQTQHMFVYPALTLLYPVCHFAWQSLQAIHHGTRLHNLWQRLFLIHKSQKDQFKIHEQSVLQQPLISVTVGQWRHGATERKVLHPLILQKDTHTNILKHTHAHMKKRFKEGSGGCF